MRSRLSKGGAYAPSLPLVVYLIRHYTDQNHMRLLIVLLFLTLLSYWQSFLELVDLEVLSLSFVLFLSVKQLENGLFCEKVIIICTKIVTYLGLYPFQGLFLCSQTVSPSQGTEPQCLEKGTCVAEVDN